MSKGRTWNIWYHKNHDEQRAKSKGRRQRAIERNRELLHLYLRDHPCVDCEERDPVVLEFDHVRGEKNHTITRMFRYAYAWQTIRTELEKCDVRCANCHRRKTARERGWDVAKREGVGYEQ